MAKVTHDLSVKVGSYIAADGSTKNRWKNIGKVFLNDDGGKFLVIDRTFNPAGVPEDGKDGVLVSTFPIKENVAPVAAPIHDHDIPF